MHNRLTAALVLALSTTANAADNEESCKPQAAMAAQVLALIEQGTVSGSAAQVERLNKAVSLYDAGHYCEARAIVIQKD